MVSVDYGPRRRITADEARSFESAVKEKLDQRSPANWLVRELRFDYERELEILAVPLDADGYWTLRFPGGSPTADVIDAWAGEFANNVAVQRVRGW